MKRSDLRALVRTKLDDTVGPSYLWSDAYLNAELDEAVKDANLRARLIIDASTVSVCKLTFDQAAVDAGTGVLALDPSIIVARRVEWAPDAAGSYPSALQRRSYDELDRRFPYWRTSTGQRPYVSVQDLRQKTLMLHPIPVETGVVNLIVWRHPLADELMVDDNAVPIIDEQHHRKLVEYVCAQAYTVRDPDTFDENGTAKHLALVEAEFGPRPTVQKLQQLAVDHEEETEPYFY